MRSRMHLKGLKLTLGATLAALAISCGGAGQKPAAEPTEDTTTQQMDGGAAPEPTTTKGDATDTKNGTSAKDDALPAASAPRVTLLDPGQEPRRELRYKYNMHPQNMIMDMKLGIDMGLPSGEVVMPPTRLVFRMVPRNISSSGELTYDAEATNVKLLEGGNLPAAAKAAVAKEYAGFVGLKMHVVVDSRGITKEATVEVPASASPSMRESMDQVSDSMKYIGAPLPVEAVGVGARWRVDSVVAGRMTLVQQTEHSLVSLTPNDMQMKVTMKQSAPPQNIDVSAKVPGATARLDTYDGTGSGTTTLRFTDLVPVSSMRIHSEFGMNVHADGQALHTTTKMTVEVNVKGK
jgi:hypothetical protein